MLNNGIVYRKYGSQVYLKDIPRQKSYIFNEIAGDVLDYFSYSTGNETDELIDYMLTIYEGADLADDMREFAEYLLKEGILPHNEEDDFGDDTPDEAKNKIVDYCAWEHILHSASLELTYRCSEKCIHCYIDDSAEDKRDEELTLSDYKRILDELYEMGCMSICLTGGEVCLHRDFVDIAEYAVEKGFEVDIYTNGISMTDEQFDRLCALPLNSVSFSLYGGTAEVHDGISKVKGSFRRTVERMMMFKCAGVETYIKTVTMKQNYDDYENLLKLGKRLRIPIQTTMMIIPTHGGVSPDKLRLYDAEKYKRISELGQRYQPVKKSKPEDRDLNGPVCNAGKSGISINPYGDVFPCNAFLESLGNVKDMSISDIWYNSEKLKYITGIKFSDMACNAKDCKYRSTCTVCMGSVYDSESRTVCPTEENCIMAQANWLYHRDMGLLAEGEMT